MALVQYNGPHPIAGVTYLASPFDSLSKATDKFRSSGMDYMFHDGVWYEWDTPESVTILAEWVPEIKVKSDGGPSTYYDFLPDWVTLNDAMEYLAEHRWGKYALHLKDANKACFRFGAKEGAGPEYDAKKLVYSGLRLLVMIIGKTEVHSFLQKLIADPQFQPKR